MPALVIKTGPEAGKRYEIDGEVVIGRGDVDCVIDDAELSRRHLAVRATAAGVEIEDLGSLNGTWFEGRRVDGPTPVPAGGVIRLGVTELEVEIADRQSDPGRTVIAAVPPLPPVPVEPPTKVVAVPAPPPVAADPPTKVVPVPAPPPVAADPPEPVTAPPPAPEPVTAIAPSPPPAPQPEPVTAMAPVPPPEPALPDAASAPPPTNVPIKPRSGSKRAPVADPPPPPADLGSPGPPPADAPPPPPPPSGATTVPPSRSRRRPSSPVAPAASPSRRSAAPRAGAAGSKLGAFSPPGKPGRRKVATRLVLPAMLTFLVIFATAIALIVYFAIR